MASPREGFKYRRTNGYRLKFPTLPSLKINPQAADLRQEVGHHDILTVTYNRPNNRWYPLLKTGTPVIFEWYQDGIKSIWNGYINHVTNISAGQEERMLRISCVGASYILKKRDARVFRQKTVTDIARQIARENKLEFKGEASKRKFEQISMTGESYWAFLQEQAKRIGYAFFCSNTTLYMYPLEKLINRSLSNAPLFALAFRYQRANMAPYDRTLDEFEILKGDYFDFESSLFTVKNLSGVNPLTSKPLSASASPADGAKSTRTKTPTPLFTDFGTEVILNKPDARAAAEDMALGAKFSFPAKARGQGDPRVEPLKAVLIEGTGEETDGFWVVAQAHHTWNITGLYEIQLKLLTDGVGANSPSPFRRTPDSRKGTINLDVLIQDALGDQQTGNPVFLQTFGPQVKESEQGFSEYPSIWKGA